MFGAHTQPQVIRSTSALEVGTSAKTPLTPASIVVSTLKLYYYHQRHKTYFPDTSRTRAVKEIIAIQPLVLYPYGYRCLVELVPGDKLTPWSLADLLTGTQDQPAPLVIMHPKGPRSLYYHTSLLASLTFITIRPCLLHSPFIYQDAHTLTSTRVASMHTACALASARAPELSAQHCQGFRGPL